MVRKAPQILQENQEGAGGGGWESDISSCLRTECGEGMW